MKCSPIWAKDLKNDIDSAYERYDRTLKLTKDESAAITLYTYNSVYVPLNRALRTEEPAKIRPWFGYLRLLHTALQKLPPVNRTFCRGESTDWTKSYNVGSSITMVNQSFLLSLCSCIDVVQEFLHCCSCRDRK